MGKSSVVTKEKVLYWGVSLILALLLTVFCLLLLAFLMYQWNVSEQLLKVGIILIYPAATICLGWRIGRKAERRKFLWGLAAGTLYFLLLVLASVWGSGGGMQETGKGITTCLLCMGGGMLGGMLS